MNHHRCTLDREDENLLLFPCYMLKPQHRQCGVLASPHACGLPSSTTPCENFSHVQRGILFAGSHQRFLILPLLDNYMKISTSVLATFLFQTRNCFEFHHMPQKLVWSYHCCQSENFFSGPLIFWYESELSDVSTDHHLCTI